MDERQKRPPQRCPLFANFIKSLFTRFGAPRAIIIDRGKPFCNDQFAKVMLKYGVLIDSPPCITHKQDGKLRYLIRGLKRNLERTWGENRALGRKTEDALCAFRQRYKTTHQGEQVKDMEKKAMSHEEVAEKESDSDCNADSKPSSTLGIEHVIKADVSKLEIKKGKQDLIDLVGLEVIEKMYKDKVKYMDDGSEEIIQNFKASDLHLGEWKEVMDACPKRTGAGWTTIYTQMRQRLDALNKAKAELELYLSKPLEEQDPILKQNLLAKKKRKNVNDLHDYFKSTKRLFVYSNRRRLLGQFSPFQSRSRFKHKIPGTDIQEKDKKRAKNDQTKHGMEKTKSKVNQMKKIQLEGLKLPNLKLYYKS
ncbi:hypothetical protein Tco_0970939 [Tanacetum coccineum]